MKLLNNVAPRENDVHICAPVDRPDPTRVNDRRDKYLASSTCRRIEAPDLNTRVSRTEMDEPSSVLPKTLDSPKEKDPDTDVEPSTNAFDLVDTKPERVASSLTKSSPDRETSF